MTTKQVRLKNSNLQRTHKMDICSRFDSGVDNNYFIILKSRLENKLINFKTSYSTSNKVHFNVNSSVMFKL